MYEQGTFSFSADAVSYQEISEMFEPPSNAS
jgi:hypothetical protein